jgi:gas vesicle protein
MSEPVPAAIEETPAQEQETSSNNLAWFLTGAMIGAVVAILFAPKSGKDTRQFLSGKAQQGKDAVAEGARDAVDAGRDMFDRGRKLVEDAANLFDRGRKLVRGDSPADE